ncbi:MAG: hypothetical protein ACXWTY_08365 [Methylobacter sp.]
MSIDDKTKIILHIGVEGGSIMLLGTNKNEVGWQFTLLRNEVALFELLAEEEQEGSPISDSFPVPTWSDALELLSRYNF